MPCDSSQISGRGPLLQSCELLCLFSTAQSELAESPRQKYNLFDIRFWHGCQAQCNLYGTSMPSILAAIFSSKISWTNNETTCEKACLVLSSRLSRNTKVKADWLDSVSKHFKLPNFCASSLATLISLAKKSRLTQRYGLIKFCSTWTGCPCPSILHQSKLQFKTLPIYNLPSCSE